MKVSNHAISLLNFMLMFSLLGLFAGCGGDDDSSPTAPPGPQPGSNTEPIDPATGGTVDYENASVDIPAGALAATTDISVGIPDTQPSYDQPQSTDQIESV